MLSYGEQESSTNQLGRSTELSSDTKCVAAALEPSTVLAENYGTKRLISAGELPVATPETRRVVVIDGPCGATGAAAGSNPRMLSFFEFRQLQTSLGKDLVSRIRNHIIR